jgi:hypothetical protein
MIQYYGALWIYTSYAQKHDKRMTNAVLYIKERPRAYKRN